MTVSVCVVAYNEEQVVGKLLSDIEKQKYPHQNMEVILIDSASTDGTKRVFEEFASKPHDFIRVQVLDNPNRVQAAGWNVAIANFKEDVMIRIDAHASIPVDFVQKQMECQESGELVTGGPRPTIVDSPTKWKETLWLAENSMFGSSIAPYRRESDRKYVKSMFHAAYRREVLEKVGGFREDLGRTEDNEFHYRIREAGYKLCYDPEIESYQHIRNSLSLMLKQKYGNGYWIGRTVYECPKCLSLYHFVPFAFVVGIVITTILTLCHLPLLGWLMWGAYWLLAFGMSLVSVIGQKKLRLTDLLLPGLFFLLHVTYGIGTVIGLLRIGGRNGK